jgi:hypothetical protein
MSLETPSSEVNVEDVMRLIREQIEQRRQGGRSDKDVACLLEERIGRVLNGLEMPPRLLTDLSKRSPRWNVKIVEDDLYASGHGSVAGRLLGALRRRLNPLLRLLINPNPLISSLHRQSQINTYCVYLLQESLIEATRLGLQVESLNRAVRELTAQVQEMAPKPPSGNEPA